MTGWFQTARQRIWIFLLLGAVILLLISSDELHAWLLGFLPVVESNIRERPVLGVLFFVLFAALSAMLAFVSSAVIVPVGIYVWGNAASMLLLWIGWILGGISAYSLSRYLGRPIARSFGPGDAFKVYEARISRHASFGLVLLFQLAMPSEVPGYLLGLAGYNFWKYICALALAELPYAVATIYVGSSFLERRFYLLIGIGLAVAAFSGWALYTLHRRMNSRVKDDITVKPT
jgi:uncharacterized membrane protein YdjX (TVP38/TMEM64 family)